MAFKQPFSTASPLLVNVDASDAITKTGHILFYAVKDTANVLSLSRLPIESGDDNAFTSFSDTTDPEADIATHNIDVTFATPQSVKGDCFVSATYHVQGFNSGLTSHLLKISIVHVDTDSNETVIGTEQSTNKITISSQSVQEWKRDLVKFDISKTNFAIGEKLRLKIIQRVLIQSGGQFVNFFHDGANRDITEQTEFGSQIRTDIQIQVPFEIEG